MTFDVSQRFIKIKSKNQSNSPFSEPVARHEIPLNKFIKQGVPEINVSILRGARFGQKIIFYFELFNFEN